MASFQKQRTFFAQFSRGINHLGRIDALYNRMVAVVHQFFLKQHRRPPSNASEDRGLANPIRAAVLGQNRYSASDRYDTPTYHITPEARALKVYPSPVLCIRWICLCNKTRYKNTIRQRGQQDSPTSHGFPFPVPGRTGRPR